MSNVFDKRFWSRMAVVLVAALSVGAFLATSAEAQRASRDEEEEEGNSNRTFSPDIGEIVVAAQEKMSAEPSDIAGAMADLNRALTDEDPSPYELGVILMIRGGLKYQEYDDAQGALSDWNRALTEGDLGQSERLGLMYNVGQVYLAEGNYREAVNRIEDWLRQGGTPNDKVHLNLVAAYNELGELDNALRHALAAFDLADPREKKHYDALVYLYGELNRPADKARVLSEEVVLFPEEKGIWTAIAQLHAEAGREQKAFEIYKIMYLNGMLTSESEIMRVVDYYSYYEVPYRGARILEKELNAGRVERNQKNLEKLARLYRQANEFDKAIPPLEGAARMSPDGELFQTLGEAYYAEGRLQEAEDALLEAINKGGLDSPGDVWVVVGNARYERDELDSAIEAFEEAEKFPESRETAVDWADFVEREIGIAREQEEFKLNTQKGAYVVSCKRQIADIVLYRSNWQEGDPDCLAIVNDDDFSSVPEIVAEEQRIIAKYEGGGEVAEAGGDDPATPAATETEGEGEPAETEAGR